MKNKILLFVFMAVGAVALSATNGFTYPNYCENPGGRNCAACHQDESDCIVTPPPPPPTCMDNDGDGYGNPGNSVCDNGSARDCNDNNASINPGAAENCTDGIDNNCNNLTDAQDPNALDCPIVCTDDDNDTYSPDGGLCGQTDCNDNAASVNPGAFEVCDDGIDNDCNNQLDCDDNACAGDPACISTPPTPPEPFCGDGNIDAGEQCDDGNAVSGDGCSSTCQAEEYTPPPSNEEEDDEEEYRSSTRDDDEEEEYRSSTRDDDEEEEYRSSTRDDDRYERRERKRNYRRSYRDRD